MFYTNYQPGPSVNSPSSHIQPQYSQNACTNSSNTNGFSGFHTNYNRETSPQNNHLNSSTQHQHQGFNGFHTNSSSFPRNVSGSVRDNFGGNQSMQASIPRSSEVLQQEYGISQNKPRHPQFALKSDRIATFRHFPSGFTQTPEQFAEAGLFYTGKDDVVFCFFCGQGLKAWEPNDNVWFEHARWAPQCGHVLNCKGRDFILQVQLEFSPDQPFSSTQNGTDASHIHSPVTPQRPVDTVDGLAKSRPRNQTDLSAGVSASNTDLLNTVAAESVVMNGYDKALVLKAINVFQLKEGRSDFSAADLLSIILDIEDGTVNYDELFPKGSPEQNATMISVSEVPDAVVKKMPSSPSKDEIDETRHLLEENRQLKDQTLCKICLEEVVSIVFLPCGHLCCCSQCAPALKNCPMCRSFIKGTIKTYLS